MKRNDLRTYLPAILAFAAFSLAACVTGPPRGAVYASFAPPPARVEVDVMGVAPTPEHVWIAGHHAWEGGNYVWVPGRWDKRPRPGARWVPGEWRHHSKGWYWNEGRWK